MNRRWLSTIVAAVFFVSVVAVGTVRYRRADPPLIPRMVRICGNMPFTPRQVILFDYFGEMLLQEDSPDDLLYTVNIRTGKRTGLTKLNRQVARYKRDVLSGGRMRASAVSPHRRWLCFSRKYDGDHHNLAAAALDGSRIIQWPDTDRNVTVYSSHWLPDSSGCLSSIRWLSDSSGRVSTIRRDNVYYERTYRLSRPGKVIDKRLPAGFRIVEPPGQPTSDDGYRADVDEDSINFYVMDKPRSDIVARRFSISRPGQYPCDGEPWILVDRHREIAIFYTIKIQNRYVFTEFVFV